jgi:hypothetical protein
VDAGLGVRRTVTQLRIWPNSPIKRVWLRWGSPLAKIDLMHKLRRLTCLSLFGSGALISTGASSDVSLISQSIIGIVSHVDEQSVMHIGQVIVKSPAFPDREAYALKEWALDISPTALASMVVGRNLICRLVYETENYLAVSCHINFRNRLSLGVIALDGNLNSLAPSIGLGTVKCSSSDAWWWRRNPEAGAPNISRQECLEGGK